MRHELIHSGNFIPINQIYWGTSGITTQAKFTTMVLLTILHPFLTGEARTTGFEGVVTEICLIQHMQTKTDSMHARQDRVLGEVSWMRGQCQKHECRSQQADIHGFEVPARTRRVARWRRRTLLSQVTACARPPQQVPAPRNVDDGPQLISLKVQHTNPGLACSPDKAQIEVPGSEAGRQERRLL